MAKRNLQRVSALNEHQELLGRMTRAFANGDFSAACEAFDGHLGAPVPFEATLLRARLHLKKDPETALQFLIDRSVPVLDVRADAERRMLLAIAYGRLQQFEASAQNFGEARAAARQLRDRTLSSEIAYWRARDYVMQADVESAISAAAEIELDKSERARMLSMHIHSTILREQRRFTEQAHALISLLDAMEQSGQDFVEIRVWATHSLAGLAREMYIPQARPVIERNLSKPWPEVFTENQFQAIKALAWTCALQGDYFSTFRYLKRVMEVAPSAKWKTVALLDRAYLARCIGETRWSRQELAEAQALAEDVDWLSVQGEERIALLLFSELLTAVDAGKAAYYMGLYQRMPPLRDPLLAHTYDDRLEAMANYAIGTVHITLGNRSQGVGLLKKSLQAFSVAGYDWRAGRCALAVYDSTHDANALTLAQEKLRHYSASWLGDLLSETLACARVTNLSPVQEQIFREICLGRSTDEIVEKYNRSKFTIRNHIKQIFKKFNVNTRSALVAEASRRGLI